MIVLNYEDPNFLLTRSVRFSTSEGPVDFAEGEVLSLRKRNNSVLIGDIGSTCLYITSEMLISDLLGVVSPITFNFNEDTAEDFDIIIESDCSSQDKINLFKENTYFDTELNVTNLIFLDSPLTD
jgi:hypothetical protein